MIKKICEYTEPAVSYILSIKDEGIKNLEAEEVAAVVNKNLFFLNLAFLLEHKRSIKKFILREKLSRAYFALEEEQDISILELSERLGFNGVWEFEHEFNKYFCVAPGRYLEIKKGKKDLNTADQEPNKSVIKLFRN